MNYLKLAFCFILTSHISFSQSKSIRIRINDDQPKATDTIFLQVWDNILASPNDAPCRVFKCLPINGLYEFSIKGVTDVVRISVSKVKNKRGFVPFIDNFLTEPGDDVYVKTGKIIPTNKFRSPRDSVMTTETLPNILFLGKGSEKYGCQRDFLVRGQMVDDSIRAIQYPKGTSLRDSLDYRKLNLQSPDALKKIIYRFQFVRSAQYEILDNRNNRLSSRVRNILAIDIVAKSLTVLTAGYRDFYINAGRFSSKHFTDSLRSILRQIYLLSADSIPSLFDHSAIYSVSCLEFLIQNALAHTGFSYDDALHYIDNHYKSDLKDKLLTSFFIMGFFAKLGNPNDGIAFALERVKNEDNLKILTGIQNNQAIGKVANDFELPDLNNKTVRLSDFRGKVVFLDFWYTGCMGCAEYYQSNVSIAEEYFKDSSAVVFITISIDTNKDEWKRSILKNIYTSNLAFNLYTDGKGSSHPAISNYLVTGYPRPILISKNGKIFSNSYIELQGKSADSKTLRLVQCISRALNSNL